MLITHKLPVRFLMVKYRITLKNILLRNIKLKMYIVIQKSKKIITVKNIYIFKKNI